MSTERQTPDDEPPLDNSFAEVDARAWRGAWPWRRMVARVDRQRREADDGRDTTAERRGER